MTTADDGDPRLEWTGERYVPELTGNIRLEHVHRYLLARELVKDRRVLDIACGEGYGADLLASVAASVTAVDIVPNVLQHGFRRYRRPHLHFVAGSCTAIPIADQSVDVVVSFETLEHIAEHDAMMREVKRVLSPGGLLIISSPDRREYSDLPGYRNPFHVRELYRDEFERLLAAHFRSMSLVGQRVKAGSVVGPLDRAETSFLSFDSRTRADKAVGGLHTPLYLIGVATDGQLPRIPTGLLDGGEFIWSSEHVSAFRGLQEQQRSEFAQFGDSRNAQEAAAATLRAELERHTALVTSLAAERARAEERTDWLQEEIDRRGSRIAELDAALAQLLQVSNEAHQALEEARTQIGELQAVRRAGEERESDLAATISALQQSQAGLAAKLDVIETSRSWRLTAPLRRLRSRLSRPRAKVIPGAPPPPQDAPPHDAPRPASYPTPRSGPIVVVAHDAHLFGAQLLALHLARTLARTLGHEVHLLLQGDGPLRQDFEATSQVHEFYAAESTRESRRQVIRHLREIGADVALCNTAVVGETVALLKEEGFAVVSMIHELPGLIRKYHLEESIASIATHADRVVFAARLVRDRFVELTHMDPTKAVVRPQGLYTLNRYKGRIDEARAELRSRLGVGPDTRILLGMGSADLRKGIDLFVEAGILICQRQANALCLWVGPQNTTELAPVQARVVQAGRQSEILFQGPARDPDLYFAGSDAYLMTSREDPFPAVVLEALDAEIPVVAFEGGGGFVELLRRHSGILVPHLDAAAMAEAVERVLDDASERRRLAAVGREIIDREFDFARYARFLTQIARPRRVSVIVPNYNYAHYLPSRLESILAQTYPLHEIIFLDDHSSDDSVAVAKRILSGASVPFRIIANTINQGCYPQWLEGIRAATGDLIWIAEADDDCAPTLVETLVPHFASESVILAYCQSKQIDEEGRELAPDYLGWTSDVQPTKWHHPYVRSGVDEIRDSLIVKNTIPNVSAVLMRRPDLSAIETTLRQLRNAGDWLVYVHLLERGEIAFVPEVLNYHRRHARSVTIGHGGLNLLRENLRVQRYILERHSISIEVERLRDACLQTTYEYFGLNISGPASYKDCADLQGVL